MDTQNLKGFSFHSVKGGVGRSHLAMMKAVQMARENPNTPVYFIDVDFTGTSIFDGVSHLEAPSWEDDPELTPELLESKDPNGFHSNDVTQLRFRERSANDEKTGVVFFNDLILHQPVDWEESKGVSTGAVSWRIMGGPNNLRIVPCSPLPQDIDQILPILNDEEHSGFIEAKIENFLDQILSEKLSDVIVVFDCARGFFGVSKSVISLGLRMSDSPKLPLSDRGDIPPFLKASEVEWEHNFVHGTDQEDVIASQRWIDAFLADVASFPSRSKMKVVKNDWRKGR